MSASKVHARQFVSLFPDMATDKCDSLWYALIVGHQWEQRKRKSRCRGLPCILISRTLSARALKLPLACAICNSPHQFLIRHCLYPHQGNVFSLVRGLSQCSQLWGSPSSDRRQCFPTATASCLLCGCLDASHTGTSCHSFMITGACIRRISRHTSAALTGNAATQYSTFYTCCSSSPCAQHGGFVNNSLIMFMSLGPWLHSYCKIAPSVWPYPCPCNTSQSIPGQPFKEQINSSWIPCFYCPLVVKVSHGWCTEHTPTWNQRRSVKRGFSAWCRVTLRMFLVNFAQSGCPAAGYCRPFLSVASLEDAVFCHQSYLAGLHRLWHRRVQVPWSLIFVSVHHHFLEYCWRVWYDGTKDVDVPAKNNISVTWTDSTRHRNHRNTIFLQTDVFTDWCDTLCRGV